MCIPRRPIVAIPTSITQRLLKAAMNGGASPYTTGELATLADALHEAGGRGREGRAADAQVRGGAAAVIAHRRPFRCDCHRRVGEGHVGANRSTRRRRAGWCAGSTGWMSVSAYGCDWCRPTSRAASSISSEREFPRVSVRISGSLLAHTSTLRARNSIAPGWRNWQTHRT